MKKILCLFILLFSFLGCSKQNSNLEEITGITRTNIKSIEIGEIITSSRNYLSIFKYGAFYNLVNIEYEEIEVSEEKEREYFSYLCLQIVYKYDGSNHNRVSFISEENKILFRHKLKWYISINEVSSESLDNFFER